MGWVVLDLLSSGGLGDIWMQHCISSQKHRWSKLDASIRSQQHSGMSWSQSAEKRGPGGKTEEGTWQNTDVPGLDGYTQPSREPDGRPEREEDTEERQWWRSWGSKTRLMRGKVAGEQCNQAEKTLMLSSAGLRSGPKESFLLCVCHGSG